MGWQGGRRIFTCFLECGAWSTFVPAACARETTAGANPRHTSAEPGGGVQQVRGLGVVGHQPLLKPGEQFEYTSWAQIATPQGSMQGRFFCITEDAHWFESPVPEFALADTAALH